MHLIFKKKIGGGGADWKPNIRLTPPPFWSQQSSHSPFHLLRFIVFKFDVNVIDVT